MDINQKQSVFANGTKWLYADFHLHTMKDKEFEEKNANTDEYVQHLKKAGIQIGVITNHNKFNRHEYLCISNAALKLGIWILPGVELSVKDGLTGVHALIIFDPDSWISVDSDFINPFLTAAFDDIPNYENANARCNYDLNTLFQRLDAKRVEGKDSFTILAHVDSTCGFFTELMRGRIEELFQKNSFWENVIALQKSRPSDNPDKDYRNWKGSRPLALVEGSDCKSLSEIGKAPLTFVKIGDFDFNALKLALKEQKSRKLDNPPKHNNVFIKSMQIIGGKLDGMQFNFSSNLNCLVGIRGSGKSAILELLRYALDIPLTSASADRTYKNDLIEYILGSGGKITVNLIGNHEISYNIEKIYGQKAMIYKEDEKMPLSCTLDAVFKMPIYFGQKDLSNKDDDFEADLLRRLTGNNLADSEKEIQERIQDVRYDILEMEKSSNISELMNENLSIIQNTEEQLKYFKDNGLDTKLKVQADYQSDRTLIDETIKKLKSFDAELKNIQIEYEEEFAGPVTGSASNQELFSELNNILKEVKDSFCNLDTLRTGINASMAKVLDIMKKFEEKSNALSEDFAKMKRELNTDMINPDAFLKLNQKLSVAKLKIQQIRKQEEQQTKQKQKLEGHLGGLNNAWLAQFHKLEAEAKKVNEANNNIHIDITFKGNRKKFVDMLQTVFRGIGLRGSCYDNLSVKYSDFIEMYRDKSNWKALIPLKNVEAFETRFNENLAELLTYKVDDDPVIMYKGKPLNKYSLGQRASALILFLLAQKETAVLIIDQPEDDLDNQTIYNEVIKSLLTLKDDMQFIFATHNANIPVLGDSEKVFCCSSEDPSKIMVDDGTIDTPEIQKKIINIMEGGKEAFEKRKQIYAAWEN